MKKSRMAGGVALVTLLAAGVALGGPGKKDRGFEADLSGYNEAPLTLSVAGSGTFEAELNDAGTMLMFTLKYKDLSGNAAAAHVHLGRPGIAGGVMFFLCGGGRKPACPSGTSGTVTGTVVAADVIGPAGQGIAAGEFDEVLAAMRAGATYANVHTALFPGGEIRGRVKGDRGKGGNGKKKDDDEN